MAAKKDDWMKEKWRPAMGWTYRVTCIVDFVVFPVLWSILQAVQGGQVNSQWSPITLQGAGLFHLAMGAVLGVAAWSRGQEKMAGAASGFNNSPTSPMSFTNTGYQTNNSFMSSGSQLNSDEVSYTANGKKIVPMSPKPLI